jgi:hypothetical protein
MTTSKYKTEEFNDLGLSRGVYATKSSWTISGEDRMSTEYFWDPKNK